MCLTEFSKHKREWFQNRVGEIVEKQYTKNTPPAISGTKLPRAIMICSNKHAEALYVFHLENKVNFIETDKK
mgnify:CR=1 FL=1